jgi:hypothetical protein
MAAVDSKDTAGFPILGLTSPLNSISNHCGRNWDEKDRPRFPNAISDWGGMPLMVRERNMMAVMDRLTDKPEWDRKIFDEEILAKWKKEVMVMFKDEPPEKQFSEDMWGYVSDLCDPAEPSSSFSVLKKCENMRRKISSSVSYQLWMPLPRSSSPTAPSLPSSRKIFEWRPLPSNKYRRAPRTGTLTLMRRS